MLRSGIENPERRARFASVYGIIGSLTIPLNFVISRVLQSIHPAVFGPSVNAAQQGGFGVSVDRSLILIVSIAALTAAYLFLVRARIALLQQEEALNARKAALTEV